ncbi:unnamed protein product [Lactuca saligna]|uniref:Uncharacterized protein n=1 Tax=Lactuca saligna TaxID=75948 RepID=A0AA35VHX0_LACSI|nr:unnamed protein product [Lactuca saligna]
MIINRPLLVQFTGEEEAAITTIFLPAFIYSTLKQLTVAFSLLLHQHHRNLDYLRFPFFFFNKSHTYDRFLPSWENDRAIFPCFPSLRFPSTTELQGYHLVATAVSDAGHHTSHSDKKN